MTLADRIAAIEARADAATKGPWREDDGQGYCRKGNGIDSDEDTIVETRCDTCQGDKPRIKPENLSFIAAARSDVPALCAALKVACEAIERLGGNHHPDLPYGRDDVAPAALASIERILGGGK
jgi:hypothetical protein